ncbi:TPA_asm: hypothetical protein [Phytophthora water mold MELD virus]|nr:TPA_asm: hypothetical protein [Phytophthora water mold MELD virus]
MDCIEYVDDLDEADAIMIDEQYYTQTPSESSVELEDADLALRRLGCSMLSALDHRPQPRAIPICPKYFKRILRKKKKKKTT